MTKKHTPGPWKCGQYLGQSSWIVHMDVGDRGRGIEIVDGVAGLTAENRFANARLIAAAPDLLNELAWIRQFLHKQDGGVGIEIRNLDGKECRKWLDRVDAAISKATNTL